LADVAAGELSDDSGNGELYHAGTGVWTITGSVADVNAALAAVVFRPAADTDYDTEVSTHVEDSAGTGPDDGVIDLIVTSVTLADGVQPERKCLEFSPNRLSPHWRRRSGSRPRWYRG